MVTALRQAITALARNAAVQRTRGFRTSTLQNAITNFTMPAMSPTMSEGSIVAWKKEEGQSFIAGDVLLEIETDKAQIEVEASEDGVLAKILVKAGNRCPVGAVIALTAEEGDDISNVEELKAAASASPETSNTITVAETRPLDGNKKSPEAVHPRHPKPLSPAVHRLLSMNGIEDASSITATGPKGRLLKGDVLTYLGRIRLPKPVERTSTEETIRQKSPEKRSSPPSREPLARSQPYVDIPIEALRMAESKQMIPQSYIEKDVVLNELLELQQTFNEKFKLNVTLNDLFIKAAALAAHDVPRANARFDPNADDPVRLLDTVDLSVMAATESGVVRPIVRRADEKGLKVISEILKEPVSEPKEEEADGGSISFSNLGIYNVTSFTGVINPQHACILAVGGIRHVAKIPDVANDSDEGSMDTLEYLTSLPGSNNENTSRSSADDTDIVDYLTGIQTISPPPISVSSEPNPELESAVTHERMPGVDVAQTMSVKLSIDQRVIDMSTAAQVLDRFAFYVQSPDKMFL